MTNTLVKETPRSGVVVIRLNRPARLNAINAAMLAEAVCKLEGFTYAPSDTVYWQHGHSTERDFLYVTTANLNQEQLQALSDEVGAERSLLVVCSAHHQKTFRTFHP